MQIQCLICGYSHDAEIVSHVNQEHKGGVGAYSLVFPGMPLVSQDILSVMRGFKKGSESLLASIAHISEEDRGILIESISLAAPERSEIFVSEDF